jgi:hypothetical protein
MVLTAASKCDMNFDLRERASAVPVAAPPGESSPASLVAAEHIAAIW